MDQKHKKIINYNKQKVIFIFDPYVDILPQAEWSFTSVCEHEDMSPENGCQALNLNELPCS